MRKRVDRRGRGLNERKFFGTGLIVVGVVVLLFAGVFYFASVYNVDKSPRRLVGAGSGDSSSGKIGSAVNINDLCGSLPIEQSCPDACITKTFRVGNVFGYYNDPDDYSDYDLPGNVHIDEISYDECQRLADDLDRRFADSETIMGMCNRVVTQDSYNGGGSVWNVDVLPSITEEGRLQCESQQPVSCQDVSPDFYCSFGGFHRPPGEVITSCNIQEIDSAGFLPNPNGNGLGLCRISWTGSLTVKAISICGGGCF